MFLIGMRVFVGFKVTQQRATPDRGRSMMSTRPIAFLEFENQRRVKNLLQETPFC